MEREVARKKGWKGDIRKKASIDVYERTEKSIIKKENRKVQVL